MIRHLHPQDLSPELRTEKLEALYRACLAGLGQRRHFRQPPKGQQ